MKQETGKYLVIGASGKTGSRVYQKLSDMGFDVKGASRNGEIYFDWQASETWARALLGVNAVYVTYYPDLAMPQAPDDIAKFCALAKIKGVKHITLLSGRGEPAAQVCEEIVQTSGLSNTIVRASWFNQNFSEGMFHSFIETGSIQLPVGAVGEPFVDTDDICDVVVASLLDERHNGQLYEVTGPELLSFAQLAEIFSKVLRKPVTFTEVSLQGFIAMLQSNEVDSQAIGMLTYLFTEVLDGRNAYVVNGVEQALGRPARTFEQFVIANQDRFG